MNSFHLYHLRTVCTPTIPQAEDTKKSSTGFTPSRNFSVPWKSAGTIQMTHGSKKKFWYNFLFQWCIINVAFRTTIILATSLLSENF